MTLKDSVPSTANVKTYAKIVEEQYYLRTLIGLSQHIIDEAVSNNTNAVSLLEYAEQKIYDIRQGSEDDDPKKLSDVIVNDVYDRYIKSPVKIRKNISLFRQALICLTDIFQVSESQTLYLSAPVLQWVKLLLRSTLLRTFL